MLLVSISNFKNDLTFLSRTGAMYTGFENMALEYPFIFLIICKVFDVCKLISGIVMFFQGLLSLTRSLTLSQLSL